MYTIIPICETRAMSLIKCFLGGIMSCNNSLWGAIISVTDFLVTSDNTFRDFIHWKNAIHQDVIPGCQSWFFKYNTYSKLIVLVAWKEGEMLIEGRLANFKRTELGNFPKDKNRPVLAQRGTSLSLRIPKRLL